MTGAHLLRPSNGWLPRAVAALLVAYLSSGWLDPLSCGTTASRDPFFSSWETVGTAEGLPSDKVFAVLADGPRVWAGTEQGLALVEQGKVRVYDTSHGLPFPAVTALALGEPSGDLWIGTMSGLARLSAGRIDVFTQLNSGLVNDVVYAVAVEGTEVWVATAAGLSRFDTRADVWEIFDTSNTLMHEPWTYSVTASKEAVYVAVWGGGVIVRDAATGQFREHRDPDGEMEIDLFRDDGLVHDVTSAISVSDGVMWVGTYFGLSRYDGRRWRSYSEEDSGLVGNFINQIKARDGVVWIATDQGLGRFDSEIWHAWKRRPEAQGWELRITDAAGESRTLPQRDGPGSNMIFAIDLNDQDVWLATAAGLSHGVARRLPGSRAPTGE